jgi:hypothetical protein
MTTKNYESYTDNIKQLITGKQYAGKNIQTSDGKFGYVTNTGVVKQYGSQNSLSVLNGCATSFEQLNTEWEQLGFPIGSAMVDGQTCGNESKYVQSKPPKTTLDWQYYISANPGLNLTTEQQAIDHWTSTGIHQGLLPNQNILLEMSNVGKIGYVDANTSLHTVPVDAYKHTGKYTLFDDVNVTGINMVDCSRTIPFVKYGDKVFMKFNDQYAKMNSANILEFGTDKTAFYLRPSATNSNAPYMNGTPIKYGDEISISANPTWKDNCGFWGCRVGIVNPETYIMGFGHGDTTGGTPVFIVPPNGSTYTNGTEIKYTDPFNLIVTINEPSKLQQDKQLTPGQHIVSGNGNYVFTYQTDGNICLYDANDGSLIWNSGKLHTPSKLVMGGDGNLVAYDTSGRPQWASNSRQKDKKGDHSHPHYSLHVQNDRNVIIYEATKKNTIWSTKTNTTTSDDDTNKFKIGYVNNNNMIFGSMSQSVGKSDFIFLDVNHDYAYDLSCDLEALNRDCNSDASCTGFIHLQSDNTWQKIANNATADLYKITDAPPKIYVKESNIDMQDNSCTPGQSIFIESNEYNNYPKGNDFIMNSDQCNLQSSNITFPVYDNEIQYNKMNNNYLHQKNYMSQKYPNNQNNVQTNNELYRQMHTKTNEYKSLLKRINTEQNKNIITYDQLNKDMNSEENTNKSKALLWGFSSIIIIGAVVMLKNKVNN